jgi:tetratricopeptide (TPR) repeat protein
MPARKARGSRSTDASEVFIAAEKSYSEAMRLLVEQHAWERAEKAFREFLETYGERQDLDEFAERARMHVRVCQLKQEPPAEEPESAGALIIEAVYLGNEGRVDEALAALEKAGAAGAPRGRVEYIRASVLALDERYDEATEALRKAVEADPRNRAFSLGDPDFERLRETAGFASVVDPVQGEAGEPTDDAEISDDFPQA